MRAEGLRRSTWTLVAGATMLAATAAHGEDAFAPTQKWGLNLQPASCSIGRAYASDGAKLVLGVAIEPPSRQGQFLLAAPGALLTGSTTLIFKVQDAPPIVGRFDREIPAADGRAVRSYTVAREYLPTLLRAQRLRIEGGGTALTVALGGSSAVLGSLTDCEAKLLQAWHIDPALPVAAQATELPAQTVTVKDYPKRALRNGEQGDVTIAWRVEASGRVEECRVIESSGWPDLDTGTCALARDKFRYRPATDAMGGPQGWDRLNVNWRIP